MKYIKGIEIKGLWGANKNILWENIHSDVNILVGMNGSGKTTLLNLIWGLLNDDSKLIKKYNLSSIEIKDDKDVVVRSYPKDTKKICPSFNGEFISTFDVSVERKTDSPLTSELLNVIYTTGKRNNSFFDYRLKASNFPERAGEINERIHSLYGLINKQFSATGKK
jgi:energy-coupling factor transporter ATP-binding protein EcfA2